MPWGDWVGSVVPWANRVRCGSEQVVEQCLQQPPIFSIQSNPHQHQQKLLTITRQPCCLLPQLLQLLYGFVQPRKETSLFTDSKTKFPSSNKTYFILIQLILVQNIVSLPPIHWFFFRIYVLVSHGNPEYSHMKNICANYSPRTPSIRIYFW